MPDIDAEKRRVTSPVWMFYESDDGTEVVARPIIDEEDFTDVEISPGDIHERGDMLTANPEDFSDKRLMKRKVFTAMFKQIRRDKE